MGAKTTHDLLESGVPLERIQAAWTRASVRRERAKRSGGICRLCGEKILRGEDVVISNEEELVILYSAFWSLSVRAHLRCYEELRKAGISTGIKASNKGLLDLGLRRRRPSASRGDVKVVLESGRKDCTEDVQHALEGELERLKSRAGIGHELKVSWRPNEKLGLSGEVKGGTIYIYEHDPCRALDTLRHEFMDWLLSRAIEPYRMVTNKLIELVNEIAYRRKEEVVESILKLMDS